MRLNLTATEYHTKVNTCTTQELWVTPS